MWLVGKCCLDFHAKRFWDELMNSVPVPGNMFFSSIYYLDGDIESLAQDLIEEKY
jgi:hypothetical protein